MKKYLFGGRKAGSLLMIILFSAVSVTIANANGLQELENPQTMQIVSAEIQDYETSGEVSKMEINFSNDELVMIVNLKAEMTVPEAGVEIPMELDFEAELRGWCFDESNYALQGQKKVQLSNQENCIEESFWGTGEKTYRFVGADLVEDDLELLPSVIKELSMDTEDFSEHLQMICKWINNDLEIQSDWFLQRDTEDGSIGWCLKDEVVLELTGQYDHYRIVDLEIIIKNQEASVPRTLLSEKEMKRLDEHMFGYTVRQAFREYNSSEDDCYMTKEGNPFIEDFSGKYFVALKREEGEECKTYASTSNTGLMAGSTEYEIWMYTGSVKSYIEYSRNMNHTFGTIVDSEEIEGTVLFNGKELPFTKTCNVVKEWDNSYSLEEAVYGGILLDNRQIIGIEINRTSDEAEDPTMLVKWTEGEVERILQDFMQRIYIIPGIERSES